MFLLPHVERVGVRVNDPLPSREGNYKGFLTEFALPDKPKSVVLSGPHDRQGGTMKTFKIATYNVNSVRSRLPIVLPWLEKNRPSVLCLQETKTEDAKFPAKEFEDAGWNVAYRGGKSYNGVAIVSSEKPDKVSCGLDDGGPPDEDRLIRAAFSGIK